MDTKDLQPHLHGELIELRPMHEDDWQDLFSVAADPLIWELHPASDRFQEEVFRNYFRDAVESGAALVVIDRKNGGIIGSSRYFGFDRDPIQLEIGGTFLAREYWGGTYNAELKRMMIGHAFTRVNQVFFVVGATNFRSIKALEKIGAVFTGRHVMRTDRGRENQHVIYQISKPTED